MNNSKEFINVIYPLAIKVQVSERLSGFNSKHSDEGMDIPF